MKTKLTFLKTEGREFPLVFNLNVMEEIQEHYGSISAWGDVVQGDGEEPKIKDLKYGLQEMINEGIDILNEQNGTEETFVNSKQVGRIISEVGLNEVTKVIQSVTIASVETDGEPKNV